MERPTKHKHSSLLWELQNYQRKKFYETWFRFSFRSFREPFPGSDQLPVDPLRSGPAGIIVSVIGVGWKPDVDENRVPGL
jgi:hypothetical protein